MTDYKSPTKWKKLINERVSPEEFQDLCRELLIGDGFKNVKPRGGGADGGRDLEGAHTYQITGREEVTENCWFQCKRIGHGVSVRDIAADVQRANTLKVDKFFILSNKDTTPPCKDFIKQGNQNNRCKIIDRSGSMFLDMLWSRPYICKKYFPDENVPPTVDIQNPEDALKKSSEMVNNFGIELRISVPKGKNINDPNTVADIVKTSLLNLKKIDLNVKSIIYQKISMLFFALNRFDDALAFLDKSIEITPKNPGALLNKGFILEKIDEIKKSTQCYDNILTFDKNNKFALNNKAYNLIRIGKLQDASKLVDKTLRLDPTMVVAIQNR